MLTFEPLFGLCNRLRALDSVLKLADKLACPIKMIWVCNSDLNCRFDELFEVPLQVKELVQPTRKIKLYSGPILNVGLLENYPLKNSRAQSGRFSLPTKLEDRWLIRPFLPTLQYLNGLLFSHRHYQRCIYEGESQYFRDSNFDGEDLKRYSSIYIQSYIQFIDYQQPLIPLQPIKILQQQIDAIASQFNPSTIGVHIRRTDHLVTKSVSTTDKFIVEMEQKIAQEPQTNFFLATDDKEEEEAMKRRFPHRIITFEKSSLNRNHSVAIKEAVIDLYCLSKTRMILGSYKSSFSHYASLISNIKTSAVK